MDEFDCLYIAYDKSKDDESVLMVTKQNGEALEVVNMFHREEADEIYNKLLRG